MKALGLIKRTFKYFNAKSLPKLYKTYVRPHLEFCVQYGLRTWLEISMPWKKFNAGLPN